MPKPLVLTVDANITPLERASRAGKAVFSDLGASAEEMLRKMDQDFQNGFRASGVSLAASLGKTMTAQLNEMKRGAEAAMAMGKDWDPLGGTNSATSAKAATGYQQAADAANVRTAAIQRVLQAEEAAGSVDQGRILQLKTMLVATKELALGMEEQAAITRSQAVAFAQVEAEMGVTANASNNLTNAHNRMGISGQMMMHSVRSASDSFAAGLPPMMIFSEQLGRVSEAMVYAAQESGKTEGAMAKLGAFMGGGWGIAVTAGISILGTLVGHMDLFQDKVGEAAKKLKEQADATHEAQQAQSIFDGTLDGAIAKERKLTEELEKQLKTRRDIINLQVSGAQQDAIEAQSKTQKAREDYEAAQRNRNEAAQQPANGEAGRASRDAAVADADQKVKSARDTYYNALTSWQNTQTNARRAEAVQIQQRAKDQATPQAAKQAALEQSDSKNAQAYARGTMTADDLTAQSNANAKAEAENKKTPRTRKPRQDHTAEREAEAEKKSDAAYDEGYAADLDALARIAKENVTDKQELARLDKEEIDAARARQRRATAEEGRRQQWSPQDIAARQGLQDQAASNRKAQVDTRLFRDLSDKDLERQQQSLAFQDQMLELQGQLSTNLKERRDIALQLLSNERQAALLGVQRDVNSGRLTVDEGAQRTSEVNQLYDRRDQQANQQLSGPLKQWSNETVRATSDMKSAFQSVAVDGIHGVEDGLTGLISGTEKASTAFTRMATSILADLARIALEKGIVSAFGLSLSTGGKVAGHAKGGLVGFRIGGLPGYAGGTRLSSGKISGPGTGTSDSILAMVAGGKPIAVSNGEGIVTEQAVKNYWPIIDSMNKGSFPKFAGGGLPSGINWSGVAYPSVPAAASVRHPAMNYTFAPNLAGAVVTQELLDQMNQMSQTHSNRAAATAIAVAPDLAVQQMTRRQANKIP